MRLQRSSRSWSIECRIPGNLCDLSKGYFATTFLSSSPPTPAKQSRLCGVFRACRNTCDIPEDLRGVTESLTSNFLNFGRKPAHFYATARSNLHETGFEGRADGTHARPADPHQAGTGFNSLRGLNTEPVESRVASALGTLARLQVCDDEIVDRSRPCVPRIGRLA